VRIPRRAIRSEKDASGNQTPQKDGVVYILCRSEGVRQRPRHSRKQEKKLIADLQKLQQRVAKGRLKEENKIQRAIGRIAERYPRVARYYGSPTMPPIRTWLERTHTTKRRSPKHRRQLCSQTDRQDLTADKIWRTSIFCSLEWKMPSATLKVR